MKCIIATRPVSFANVLSLPDCQKDRVELRALHETDGCLHVGFLLLILETRSGLGSFRRA